MWKEVCWRRSLEQAQEDFGPLGEKSERQNIWKVQVIKLNVGGKGNTGMWSKTRVPWHPETT